MKFIYSLFLCFAISAYAAEFTGPTNWKLVNTNAVQKWQAQCATMTGDDFLVLDGVVADKKKKEVRFLAEAVGHGEGTTTEFLLVAPVSDRAYESFAVTVSSPELIVKAVEFLGIKRGQCVDATKFHFIPCGERFHFYVRRLDKTDAPEQPFKSMLSESIPDNPMLSDKGFVFAGGDWVMKDGKLECSASTIPPCSVVSLYNELSIFDIPQQAGQSAVYGRLSVKAELPFGTLIEVIVRPVSEKPTVLPLDIKVRPDSDTFVLNITNEKSGIDRSETIKDSVEWLRSQSEAGFDLYVTLAFDESLTVKQTRDVASLFEILAGSGVHLYGKGENGVYYKAFLPQDDWRKREGRNPQPFELHITRDEKGALSRKLVFIEEDWNVKGIDPKLTPREYPFDKWSELEPLVIKAGGENNKVAVLFVFVPADMKLSEFMPGINALSARLPLVHIFGDK